MAKILLVEDDVHILKTLEKILKERGFEVVTAANGLEAIELAQKEELSMVITDVRMPGMDGIEALGKIKTYQPDARKLIITGYAGDDAPIRAIHLSVDDYLMKPFSPEKFLQSVETAILKYQSEAQKTEAAIFSSSLQQSLRTLVQEIETRIPNGTERSRRISELGTKLGQIAKLEKNQTEILLFLLSFHDLGYLSYSDQELENLLSIKHAECLGKIFKGMPGGEQIALLYLNHHMPFEESDENFSILPHLLFLSESFENLISTGLSSKEALQTLLKDAGKLWEPSLLEMLEDALFNPLQRFSEKPSSKIYEILLHLGKTYTSIGEIETGKAAIQKLLEKEHEIDDPDFKFRLHLALAQNLIRDQKFLEGEEEACRTLETALTLNLSPLMISSVLLEIVLARLFLEKTDKLEEFLEKGKSHFEKFSDKRNLARTELYFSILAGILKKSDHAKSHFEVCRKIVEEEKLEDFWESEFSALKLMKTRSDSDQVFNSNIPEEKGLKIYSLGPVRIYRDGTMISEEAWKSKKGKILLNYLLLNMERPVSEDKLCDLFWPQGDPERSRKNLHHVIYLLRRILEPDLKDGADSQYILSQHNAYQFNKSSTYWWDVHEFKENIQKAQSFCSSKQHEKGIETIRKLENLYGGDLLEDYLEETWCNFERDRLKEPFLNLLLAASSYYEQKQDDVMALEFAQKTLSLEPFREKTAQLVIHLLYKSGKRTEAVRKYQIWCSQLEKELNLKPSPEFAALYEKMVIGSTSY
jgi:two-component SAPR family response regulator